MIRLSLPQAVMHWARYRSREPAIIQDENVMDYSGLAALVQVVRASIRDRTPVARSRVLVTADDKCLFLASLVGILAEGLTCVVCNQSIAAPNFIRTVRDSGAALVLSDDPGSVALLKGHDLEVPVAVLEAGLRRGGLTMEPPNERGAEDVLAIIYSSGTTGDPKGIVRTDFSMLSELIGWCLEVPLTVGATTYIARPLYYTGGLVLAAATLLVGGALLLPSEHSASTYRKMLGQRKTDLVFMIPEQLDELIRAAEATAEPWPRPQRLMTMGAPVSVQAKVRTRELFGDVYIESWGNSEGLGTITAPEDVLTRPTSVGRPFLCDSVFAVDDAGNEVPCGTVGRLAGRADSCMVGYLRGESTGVTEPGLVVSDDYGYIDDAGYVYLVGRVSERILRRGSSLYAAEMVGILRGSPKIAEAAVVALRDEREGQVPGVAIVPSPGVSDADAKRAVYGLLTGRYRPAAVVSMRSLPRNTAGKVSIEELKTRFARESAPVTGGRSVLGADKGKDNLMKERPALLVVDVQRAYTDEDGNLACSNAQGTVANINRLVRYFQAHGLPVVLIRHAHRVDGSDLGRMYDYTGDAPDDFDFKECSDEVEFCPELQQPTDAIVMTKTRYSAFAATPLHGILGERGITTVVVCGFMTNFCCESTARDAHDLDYYVDFVVDATGTPGTETLNQKDIRKVVGELLGAGFSRNMTTDEYLDAAKTLIA